MKLSKFKLIGACSLLAFASIMSNSAQAATITTENCIANPTQEFSLGRLTSSDGTTIENLCYNAIVVGNNQFDKIVDSNIKNKIVIAALNSMGEEAHNNPEAKKLQELYRDERSQFVNSFLKDNDLQKLPTVTDGKRHGNDFAEKMTTYLDNNPFSGEKIKDLRTKLTEQAKKSITLSM
jgi:hypothetical protein